MKAVAFLLAAGVVLATGSDAAEVRIFPSDSLVLNAAYPARGYFDLMVPTLIIHTRAGEALRVQSARLELLKADRPLLRREFDAAAIVAATKRLASQPVQGFIDAQFIGAGGFHQALGTPAKFADSADMTGDQVLALTEEYFAFDDVPDRLVVTVTGTDGTGRQRTYTATIKVAQYVSPISYRFPLKGNWLAASGADLQSHHRFNAPAEFAVDYFRVDGNGHTFRENSHKAENWYAWGEPVMAAADGVVVGTITDQVQDRAFLDPLPGESEQQRQARVGRTMEERVFGTNARFPGSDTGNVVTIRHQSGVTVEYSSYDHLKAGSIRVKPGDHVRQGDIIAAVGDTGDTPVVHLHFQINAGPHDFNDKSLPFSFTDMTLAGATLDPGRFVEPKQ